MKLARRHDWPERLASVVTAARSRPFEWGVHDCVLFAVDGIEAVTGEDLAHGLRGRYTTERGAARITKSVTGHTGVDAWPAHFGLPECPPARARRGDVALVMTDMGPAVGVVLGDKIACAGPSGLALLSLRMATRAWRIG